jgi:hypothetical protein
VCDKKAAMAAFLIICSISDIVLSRKARCDAAISAAGVTKKQVVMASLVFNHLFVILICIKCSEGNQY